MYRHCIFCSADLDANESVEAFPVGRSLAFDASRGRLWALCAKCGRWNLAPIEERWEAIEHAEKLFRDSRLRAQSENIGLAKLPDGTRLVRVGEAVPGELAAWRYGGQLTRRRRQYLLAAGAVMVGGVVLTSGLSALVGGGMGGMASMVWFGWKNRQNQKVVYRLPAERSPSGIAMTLRAWHAAAAVFEPDGEGFRLCIPDPHRKEPKATWKGGLKYGDESLVLSGDAARAFLGRGMVHVNRAGARARRVESAVRLLSDARSAEAFIRAAAAGGGSLAKRDDMPGRHLGPDRALALEMALHEEQERRALEGELALLESAWREAEEIAGIADRLATAALAPSADER